MLPAHSSSVVGCAVDSSNRLMVSVSTDCSLRVWRFKELKMQSEVGGWVGVGLCVCVFLWFCVCVCVEGYRGSGLARCSRIIMTTGVRMMITNQ